MDQVAVLIYKLTDPRGLHRDLVLDELSDLAESKRLSCDEQWRIIEKLNLLLPTETDDAVLESSLNLMGSVYANGLFKEEIVGLAVGLLERLAPAALVHAIPLIWISGRADRRFLIAPFVNSDSAAVRSVALEVINSGC